MQPQGCERAERGQAAVETAIVMPTMIMFILGILQIAMMHHARFMVELAAFNAARAGAVWNANPRVMQDAAVLTLVPTWGIAGQPRGAATVGNFAITYGELLAAQALGGAFASLGISIKPVTVTTLSPVKEDFPGSAEEFDFDDPGTRLKSQLTVRVTYLYPLRIPYANWVIFHSIMASLGEVPLVRKVSGWDIGPVKNVTTTEAFVAEAARVQSPMCKRNGLTATDLRALIGVAGTMKQFFVPITTTYTIRMQSNPLKKNVLQKSQINQGC